MSDEQKPKFSENILDLMKNFRIWILILFLIISFFTINYQFSSGGIVINGVTPSSVAESSGISYNSQVAQTSQERVLTVESINVNSIEDFYDVINRVNNDDMSLEIGTDRDYYVLDISAWNSSETPLGDFIGLSVNDASNSNIRLGIELEGGSRLILKPTEDLDDNEFDLLIKTLQSRLDVFGASGTKVNKIEDAFSNQRFVIVESISSNKNDIFELIKRQGNFEAVIGNTTVFTGDDVFRVLNDPNHERLERCSSSVGSEGEGFICTYAFSIEITSDAGDKFFGITKNLPISGGQLSERVFFYLDGKEITSLSIASSFKYQKITNPQISVSGSILPTEELAQESARKEMEFLQAILSTQSLPSDLEVLQSYSISSSLGQKLLNNAVYIGIFALLIVSLVVSFRYRQPIVFVGIFIALATEIIIVFGMAAFLKLSIDLAAIGGLIAAIGTGVDDQIIITDEYFRDKRKNISSRKKIKNAFYIIMIAYLTTLAAMIPLYFAGLKILQGFAFMIVIGVTIGVFVTRPAYGAMLRIMMTSRKERAEEEIEEPKNPTRRIRRRR